MEFFRHYNEILFHKLEKKILDLEMANRGIQGVGREVSPEF